MNSQTKAIYVLAAAVIAHPFITKAVDGWGKYPSKVEANRACSAAKAKLDDIHSEKKPYLRRHCTYRDNHFELNEDDGSTRTKLKVLRVFYF